MPVDITEEDVLWLAAARIYLHRRNLEKAAQCLDHLGPPERVAEVIAGLSAMSDASSDVMLAVTIIRWVRNTAKAILVVGGFAAAWVGLWKITGSTFFDILDSFRPPG